ncbi:hypothetical protein [Microbacterium sp. SSM24]|uniref:hypothetical protein n=1 Tax=Microbacterium sp. SSM24 TaxID=2991714 RepID=UPI002227F598|nr:hypothetical protein [Microbacterium sp. SSM24]MCW3492384.1 hypothetical protein [Microbacterium sp. SSM24]
MSGPAQSEGGPVRPVTALVFATAAFVALLIFGLGMTSLAIGEDVVATPGLGQTPGIVATTVATLAFAAGLWTSVRRSPASYWGSAWTTAATYLGYVGGLWFGAVVTGADVAVAGAIAGRIATTWFGLVVAAAAFVCSWSGIALVRTRASRPRWPWEDEFDE